MPVHLHILNARGLLDPLQKEIEDAFSAGIAAISDLLPVNNVDVVVWSDSRVLPETGLGGYSPSANIVHLRIDPTNKNLFKAFGTEFIAALGHELHHCMRRRGPGYGRKLGEALVTEGLACHFETELRDGAPPFYARSLDSTQLKNLAARGMAERLNDTYNHKAWFFGSPEMSIPRHAGYSVGFDIVATFIKQRGALASKLWAEPAESFYEDS